MLMPVWPCVKFQMIFHVRLWAPLTLHVTSECEK